MTTPTLDRDRLRELFDLRSSYNELIGGRFTDDPYPDLAPAARAGARPPGVLHELTGLLATRCSSGLPYPDRPHFSAFDYETVRHGVPQRRRCSRRRRNRSTCPAARLSITNSMLSMDGARAQALPQSRAAVVRAGQGQVVGRRTGSPRPLTLLIDGFVGDGRAELNVDFCAAIPVLTITGSFGVPVEQALDIRAALGHDPQKVVDIIGPIVAARREQPQDDLISVLVAGRDHRRGRRHHSSHRRGDRLVRAAAARRRLGHHVEADGHHADGAAAAAGRARRGTPGSAAAASAIEESVRWMPTDPMFSRYVIADTELGGVEMPAGAVVHIGIGAGQPGPRPLGSPRRVRHHP